MTALGADWFIAMLLPWPFSNMFKALLGMVTRRDPTIFTSMGGTVGITAVGMFGAGHSGWGIFPVTQVLGLVVGSINWKPTIVDGRIEPREILNLTLVFDHTVIDGAPAARFAHRLIELIQSGYGMDQDPTESASTKSAAVKTLQETT